MRDEDLLETISATLLAIWRFQKFTESRWLTVGSATRVLVRAVLLGLDGFYQFLQKDSPHCQLCVCESVFSVQPYGWMCRVGSFSKLHCCEEAQG